jgi:hypothetical protein
LQSPKPSAHEVALHSPLAQLCAVAFGKPPHACPHSPQLVAVFSRVSQSGLSSSPQSPRPSAQPTASHAS